MHSTTSLPTSSARRDDADVATFTATSTATAFVPAIDGRESAIRSRFEQWMAALPERPELHARFLNTLSMLEHIGSVKIARTQSGPAITEEILQHLAEETRHAQVLKKLARQTEPSVERDYTDLHLLAGASARGYFARLDAGVRGFVRRSLAPAEQAPAAYLLVTWLVELRASWLYPAYQQVLESAGLRASVRSIIGEEERHLEEIEEGMGKMGLVGEGLVEYERHLFARLASAIMNEEV